MDSQRFSLLPEQFQPVPITVLDFPDALTSSLFQEVDEQLCKQVEQLGILQPLPVTQISSESFHLLAGYQYLQVLRQLRIKEIICQLVPATSAFSRYALQINHCLSTIHTSPILQALLLQSASQTLTEAEVVQFLPMLGHKPQHYKLKELISLLDLSPVALLALHRGTLAPKNGKLLARLATRDQDFLLELIKIFRPGGSKQQKLIELLIELSFRHNQPMETLIKPWMDLRLRDDPANLPQQLQGLLRYLQEQSFPHLVEAEKRFHQLIQELDLPQHVQVHHATSFEDESIELRIVLHDLPSLRKLWPNIAPLLSASS